MSYSEDFKIFFATIYGEAGNSSKTAWKVVAHSIKNRIGFNIWTKYSTSTEIISETSYDAYTDQTVHYKNAKSQMDSGNIKPEILKIIQAVEPIFNGQEKDFTEGVVSYYSPAAQKTLHKKYPNKYKSVVPDWVTQDRVHQVFIKGTEQDDFAWYKVLRTTLSLTFVDKSSAPLVGAKVDVVFADKKKVPILSNMITDKQGTIKKFDIADNLGARFKVNGVLVKDQKSREVKIVGDGKNYSAVIVVDHGGNGIKTKTENHNQKPIIPTEKKVITQKNEEKKDNSSQENVIFNIKFVDSENKPIPNISYYLTYKGSEKKHTTGANGIEQGVSAESGKEITVSISGKDSKQTISSFTVSSGKTEQIVKLDLHSFEILFQHGDTKSPISNLRLVQIYRGKIIEKQTDKSGKIAVKAMPGFNINYKLRDGSDLITIKVDKNKTLRVINVDSRQINNATKKIKDTNTPTSNSTKVESQDVKGKDETSKRDHKTTTSQDGHPKIIINDNGEAKFTILTYDEKTNKLFNGNYWIEYKGHKRSHTTGINGEGKKIHHGQIGQPIKIIVRKSNKDIVVFDAKIENGMNEIELKLEKSNIGNIDGVTVSFNGISEKWKQDIVSQKTKNVLAYLAKQSGMTNILITSTIRTPRAQAEAMYKKATKYAAPGETVKKVRDECKAQGLSKDKTIQKMIEKIIEFQKNGQKVSLHCVSEDQYKQKNVVDLGMNSNGFGTGNTLNTVGNKFKQVCLDAKSKGIISGFISADTPGEGAMHIEIAQ